MSSESQKGKQAKTDEATASKIAAMGPEEKLDRLGQIANLVDYWRNEPSSLLFTNLARADQFVRATAADHRKVLDGWDAMLAKVREVRSSPKVKDALDKLTRLSSSKNPWRLMSLLMSFGAFGVIILAIYLVPDYYLIIVPVAFVFLFGLQFYSQRKLNRLIRGNVESIQKHGGTMIQELSDSCKDLTQNIVNALRYELPKYGKGSDTFTLKLVSNDYSNVKLRIEEKVKKRGRRTGDLYSVVWK
nr:hypothetical protein [Candidatus Njordarchaeota archaeon]